MEYEREVFTIGQWRTYDDLEECLTLSELTETYIGLRQNEQRMLEGMARMWGATPKKNDGLKLDQNQEPEDIVKAPVKAKGGEKFGVGFGLGHTEL